MKNSTGSPLELSRIPHYKITNSARSTAIVLLKDVFMKTKSKLCSLAVVLFLAATAIAQTSPGTQIWVFDAGLPIAGSPAVAPDGTVYVAVLGGLFAVSNMGSNKWVFSTTTGGHGGYSSPALGSDGTVYISSGDLYAVNASGSQRWAFPANSENGSPAIGFDNAIYIHGYHLLYSISGAGTMTWSNRIGGSYTYGSPTIGPNGGIYAPSPEIQTLYAVKSDGTASWDASFPTGPSDTAAIGADGNVYTTGLSLYSFSPTGSNLWVNDTNYFMGSCPAVGDDGTVYVATWGGGSVCAVTQPGTLKWQATLTKEDPTNAPPYRCPAIDERGIIYYAAFNTLYAITPEGGVRWTFSPQDGMKTLTSPAIGPDGTIYVTFGSKLYAVYNTNKLADSPWPMYRQNARHTGKIERPSLQQAKGRHDGNFEFQLYGQINQSQTVQASTDLVSWTEVTNVLVTNVPMTVVDLSATNFPTRFYRTASP
jgi:hypothetical protein